MYRLRSPWWVRVALLGILLFFGFWWQSQVKIVKGIPTRTSVGLAVKTAGFKNVQVSDPNFEKAREFCPKSVMYYAVRAEKRNGRVVDMYVCTDGYDYIVKYR